MDRLPKVFENPIKKVFTNTQNEYKGSINNTRSIKKNINYELDKIFSSKNHIAKSRVKIILPSEELIVDIIGKTRNSVLTMDNRLIKINDIIDIERI